MSLTGAAIVAGVVGDPVAHSLSPLIHNAWIEAAGLDAVYVPLPVPPKRFASFIEALRGGVISGLNVTAPHKAAALAAADEASDRARRAGAANLLRFHADGRISADNTDGLGLIGAIKAQAPAYDFSAAPAVVLGAGGAARGAVAALLDAGAPTVQLVNRTLSRAQALAADFGAHVAVFALADAAEALDGAGLLVNATTVGLGGGAAPPAPLEFLAEGAVVMDMIYRPLVTDLLAKAAAAGLTPVDGLEMLIQQAAPSFAAFYGQPPPGVDVRALALAALGTGA
jgi:shikimate dehydrogenase